MKTTEHYGLNKPLPEEFYDIAIQNENMDIIDAELNKRAILDADGKVSAEQLPETMHIPITSEVPDDSNIWIDPDDEPSDGGSTEVPALIVTGAMGGQASHSSSEIYDRVKAGGTVLLEYADDVYIFGAYNSEANAAIFLGLDTMDGEYIRQVIVSGTKVTLWKMPFALESEVVKTVNGVEPDENGNVVVSGGGSTEEAGEQVIFPETNFAAEDGDGYEWATAEGIIFKTEAPIVAGEIYTMTVNGVAYDAVAIDGTYGGVNLEYKDTNDRRVAVVTYSPDLYGEWGDYNACYYSYYFEYDGDGNVVPETVTLKITSKYLPNSIIIRSSTVGSTKIFNLTVDDSGTISATVI